MNDPSSRGKTPVIQKTHFEFRSEKGRSKNHVGEK
jgi:hypothetical protein